MLGLQRFPVNDRVHSSEIGNGPREQFTVHVDVGAVMLRVIGTQCLGQLLAGHAIVAGMHVVVAAHGLERVGAAHEETVATTFGQDANVILTVLVVLALHLTHLHVHVWRVPRQALLLRQVGQAEVVHQIPVLGQSSCFTSVVKRIGGIWNNISHESSTMPLMNNPV